MKKLEADGRVDDAIDILFQNVDDAFMLGEKYRYLMLNYLSELDLSDWSTQMLVGLMSITRPFRGVLRIINMQKKIRIILTKREPERVDRLMKGFEYNEEK